MKEYRVCVLDHDGVVLDEHNLFCADLEELKEQAKTLAVDLPVEVWEGTRRISCFNPTTSS